MVASRHFKNTEIIITHELNVHAEVINFIKGLA